MVDFQIPLKEGSRNVGIDIASFMVLSFGPVDFWIPIRDHSHAQFFDKRVIDHRNHAF